MYRGVLLNIYKKDDDSKVRTNVILREFSGYNSSDFIQSVITHSIASHETPI